MEAYYNEHHINYSVIGNREEWMLKKIQHNMEAKKQKESF
jgi:hypothetical protein